MDFVPESETGPKREQVRRNSRVAAMDSLLVGSFRQFFATSPVACPYVRGRAER